MTTIKHQLVLITNQLQNEATLLDGLKNLKKLMIKNQRLVNNARLSSTVKHLNAILLKTNCTVAQSLTLSVISIFLTNTTYCSLMADQDILEKLVTLLSDPNSQLQLRACRVVGYIASDKDVSEALHRLSVIETLIDNLKKCDDVSGKEALIRALSRLCNSNFHWTRIVEKKGVEAICSAGTTELNSSLTLVTMKSLKLFYRPNFEFYNQVVAGTKSFVHLRRIMDWDQCSESVSVIIEELIVSILKIKNGNSSVTSRAFHKLFEAFVESMICGYILRVMMDPQTQVNRICKLLSFFCSLITTWWPTVSSNPNRGVSLVSQLQIIGLKPYLTLFSRHKEDIRFGSQCLSLISIFTASEMKTTMKSIVSACVEELYNDKSTYANCIACISNIWNIAVKALGSDSGCLYVCTHYVKRLLKHYMESPLIVTNASDLLNALPGVKNELVLSTIMDLNMIGLLIDKTRTCESCYFCDETSKAVNAFLDQIKVKYEHNKMVYNYLERRLSTEEDSTYTLLALPYMLSLMEALTHQLSSNRENQATFRMLLTTSKRLLRRLQMVIDSDKESFRKILRVGHRIEQTKRMCLVKGIEDLTIITQGGQFKMSRQVLANVSSVFHAMLTGSFKEAESDEITLTCPYSVFQHIYHFAYGCFCVTRVSCNVEDLLRLLQICDMYQLTDLLDFTVYRLGVVFQSVGCSDSIDLKDFVLLLPYLARNHVEYLFCQVIFESKESLTLQKMELLTVCLDILGGFNSNFLNFTQCSYIRDVKFQANCSC